MLRTFTYSSPVGSFTRSQSGFLIFGMSWVISILKPLSAEYKTDVKCDYKIFRRIAGHDAQCFGKIVKRHARLNGADKICVRCVFKAEVEFSGSSGK